jgi:hypothetical protein
MQKRERGESQRGEERGEENRSKRRKRTKVKKVNQWKKFSENDGNGYNLKKTGLIVDTKQFLAIFSFPADIGKTIIPS